MTEVLNADGSNHPSNARATIDDDDNDFWFGFEQEYFIMDTQTQLPLGFPMGGYPRTARIILLFGWWKKYSWKRICRRTC